MTLGWHPATRDENRQIVADQRQGSKKMEEEEEWLSLFEREITYIISIIPFHLKNLTEP